MSEQWPHTSKSACDVVFDADVVYDESGVNCEDSCGKCADLTYGDCSVCTVVCEGQKGDPGERGPRGGDCYCESQFRYFNGLFSFPSPTLYGYIYEASTNDGVLLDVEFTNASCPLSLIDPYDGWSLSFDQAGSTGVSYTGNAVAILDPGAGDAFAAYQGCGGAAQANTARLPAVLYILNNIERYSALGYSTSDIQSAIWTLLYTASPQVDPIVTANPITGVILPLPTTANVRVIINQALNAQGRYITTGELSEIAPNCINGLVLFVQTSIGCMQIIVVAVDMCTLERCPDTGPDTVLLKLSSDASTGIVEIPPSSAADPNGVLIESAGPNSLLLIGGWGTSTDGYEVPVSGNYKVFISACIASTSNDTPTLVSVAVAVNDLIVPATIGSVYVEPNNFASNISVSNTIPLVDGDFLTFYAVADSAPAISAANGSLTAFPVDPMGTQRQPWFSVILELIHEP